MNLKRMIRPGAVLAAFAFSTVAAAPAVAADRNFTADLEGFQETPAVSTVASGEFRARLSKDESSIDYELGYEGLEGLIRQAHIHFGQAGVGGGIVVWLCQTGSFQDPTGLAPICPQSGSVSGVLTAANMVNLPAQGIAAGEFAELVRALRAGMAYANVHTDKFPPGEIRGQIK
jgi:hypothetical protein